MHAFLFRTLPLILLGFMSLVLAACQAMNPHHVSSPYCNQLNSQIVFNGATGNPRQAEIENAQQALQQHNYDTDCTTQ